MRYIIPIDLINIILVAEYFIKYVFKLHGLPNLIISQLFKHSVYLTTIANNRRLELLLHPA